MNKRFAYPFLSIAFISVIAVGSWPSARGWFVDWIKESVNRQKLSEMAEYAYATGCYDTYKDFCQKVKADEPRSQCYETAEQNCEPAGKRFRSWIEQGKRSTQTQLGSQAFPNTDAVPDTE